VSKRALVDIKNGPSLFILERLSPSDNLDLFDCSIREYNEYLIQEAQKARERRSAWHPCVMTNRTEEAEIIVTLVKNGGLQIKSRP
jgi:hypothetical protein